MASVGVARIVVWKMMRYNMSRCEHWTMQAEDADSYGVQCMLKKGHRGYHKATMRWTSGESCKIGDAWQW